MLSKSDEPETRNRPGLFGRLRGWFLAGLLVTAPILLTIYITWWAIKLIDGEVASLLPWLDQYFIYDIPGAGLIIGVILITFIGAVAAGFIGRWIIRLGESILNRMPIVRSIYGAIKQILETVISTQSNAFREVVLVEYPRREIWVIGFITGNTRGEVANSIDREMVNIFVPTTPNPTSGFLLFCPREDVIYLKMSVEDAVKLVVSGGIVVPPPPPVRVTGKAMPGRAADPKAANKPAKAPKAAAKKGAKKKAAKKG